MTSWLIDKSAFSRLHLASDAPDWADRIQRGLVRISTVTRLEIGYSARSLTDHRALLTEPPIASMPIENLTPRSADRAVELAELAVLHLDKDFELIADITGQARERLNIE